MPETCVSCSAEPQYVYQTAPSAFMLFCAEHVPGFLRGKNSALLLKSYKPVEPEPEPTQTKTTKKKKAEPVVEESVVEETPAETPSEEAAPEEE